MKEREETITTRHGQMDCFICEPDENGPYPAVIFYMDAPGMREELRDMARRLGTVGYYVMLPNLYYRVGREGAYGFDREQIRTDDAELQKMFAVMKSLSNAGIVMDTEPLLRLARSEAAPGPIGVIGYCMSGQFVMSVAAAYSDDIAAVASHYGVGLITDKPDSPHLDAAKVKAECYFAFAETDNHVPDEIVQALPAVLDAAGVRHRIEVHPGTDHGFAFAERSNYVKAAGERHWERMFALFDRALRGR